MIKKILIAIDESTSALNATEYAIELARNFEAEAGLIYVTQYSIGAIDAGIPPRQIEESKRSKHHALMQEIASIYSDIELKIFEPIGSTEKEIQHVIDLWNPDLMVIGHHKHHFFKRLFQQGTEEKLLKHLSIPLLVVPQV